MKRRIKLATSNYQDCYSYSIVEKPIGVSSSAQAISMSDFSVEVNIDVDMIAKN